MKSSSSVRPESTRAGEEGLTAGRYRHQKVLGVGGMGRVWQVVDEATGQVVALKRLGGKSANPGDERARLRFQREYHTLARLRHPRILEVYDYGIDGGIPYFTMELLGGCDLQESGELGWRKACRIVRDVCSALAFLHARQLVHRDLSPRNVRLTSDGSGKLIDFGVLASVGHVDDAAGSPSLMAPESVSGLPVDPRLDLFVLGGLAYWLLAGRYAYPAHTLSDLRRVWREHPAPPSKLVGGIPEALDALVMSLLSMDPGGRPSSAAEVLDRLTAIGQLDPAPELEVSRGYLKSVPMLGRGEEMRKLRQLLTNSMCGSGSLVMIEAPSGVGKTRLLRELALEAQLAGSTVLSVRCEVATSAPYGLFHQLRKEVAAAPRRGAKSKTSWEGSVEALFPAPRAQASERLSLQFDEEQLELRAKRQRALVGWLTELASEHPVAVLVDDLQRCDDLSVSALAALANEAAHHRLTIVVSLATDEPVRAPASVAAISARAERMRLRGLELAGVESFARWLFGDVARLQRLASWMFDCTAGIPLELVELARELVDKNLVHYLGGVWELPFELPSSGDRPAARDAVATRLAGLSGSARAMANALAVLGGPASETQFVPLSGCASSEEAFAALDELEQQGIVVGAAGVYRFRHDVYLDAALEGIAAERQRQLHLLAGESIIAEGSSDPSRDAEAGWHLHRAGDVRRGARLLESAGRRLFEEQALRESAVALESAVAEYRKQGRPDSSCLELEFMLLASGAMYDRPLGLRHLHVVERYHEHIGFSVARRLARGVGRPIALIAGIGWALTRWLLGSRVHRGPHPLRAIGAFYVSLMYAAGLESASRGPDGLRRLIELAMPAAGGGLRSLRVAVIGLEGAIAMNLGNWAVAKERFAQTIHDIHTDRSSRYLASGFMLRIGEAGLRAQLALSKAITLDPGLEDDHRAMEALDLHLTRMQILVSRVVERRLRGAEDDARALEEQFEGLSLQVGSSWMLDAWMVRYGALGYALCRDVVGLKRSADQLAMLLDRGLELRSSLALIRGEYHRERGELAAAAAELTEGLNALHPEESFTRAWLLSALAETLLASEELERAAEVARECIEIAEAAAAQHAIPSLRATRALALAEAAMGDRDAAAARLERAMEESVGLRCAPIEGALHEARARIALLAGDRDKFVLHAAATTDHFGRTRNPSLITLSERLLSAEARWSTGPREARAAGAEISTIIESVTSRGRVEGDAGSGAMGGMTADGV